MARTWGDQALLEEAWYCQLRKVDLKLLTGQPAFATVSCRSVADDQEPSPVTHSKPLTSAVVVTSAGIIRPAFSLTSIHSIEGRPRARRFAAVQKVHMPICILVLNSCGDTAAPTARYRLHESELLSGFV